ncbi:MAG: MGH1-like glycoside hydrolase domain-containing protein, partial [Planctomycetota bacterium]
MSTALLVFIACLLLTAALASPAPQPAEPAVLHAETFRDYVDAFSAGDEELYTGAIANDAAWPFLRDNVPLFECPDKTLEEVYYFRWWIYRKHIRQTPDGFIITEFLPDVDWAGKHNSINCAAAHHFYEGRWLRDGRYLDDYAVFWLRRGGSLRSYSFWIADSLWSRYLVTGDLRQVKELLPDLVANY